MDSYIKISLKEIGNEDVVLGILSEFPVTGFEEVTDGLLAFVPSREWSDDLEGRLRDDIAPYVRQVSIEVIPFENWNQNWEKSYPEVEIDDFCRIYAPFHNGPGQKFTYEILISPQMAFGTGHHNTTQMMIRLMSHLPEKIHYQRVLDFGSGSGVLAILASRMGAAHVDAVEIDAYAFQNLKENIQLNNVDWVTPWQGGMEQLPQDSRYDIILANVTRGIILQHVEDFYHKLNPGGRILISGILDTDQDEVHRAFIKTGFYGLESMKIGKWTALLFGKKTQKSTLNPKPGIRDLGSGS